MTSVLPDCGASASRLRLRAAAAGWIFFLALTFLGLPAWAVELREDLWATDGTVHALVVDAERGMLYIGGEFTAVGPVGGPPTARRNLAALDLATGAATGWDPSPNLPVRAMWLAPDGATLYVGGDFTELGGQFRNRLAALETAVGVPRPWNPNVDGTVRVMIPSALAGSLYVGGDFGSVSNATRHGVAEISLLGVGFPLGLGQQPVTEPGASVHALALGTSRLYVGGEFTLPGEDEEPRRLAAIELTDFTVAPWDPPVDDGVVRALLHFPDRDVVYAGGDFGSVAGAARTGIAAFDAADGDVLSWDPRLDGAVNAIVPTLDRTTLYLGGSFGSAAGVTRENLAVVGTVSAVARDDWQVQADGEVFALVTVEDLGDEEDEESGEDVEGEHYTLYVGGAFGLIDGAPRPGLAALEALPPERQPPVTVAEPPGRFFNADSLTPIALRCDDGLGAGCDATYFTLDGSEPTTESTRYLGPLTLLADVELKFFSVDRVGNTEAVNSEAYFFEIDPPVTTVDPASRVFEERSLTVTLSCADTGSGCDATYYTLDGSLPTSASARYTGEPIVIDRTTVLQYYSVDVVGNVEGVRRSEYVHNRGEVGALAWYEALLIMAAALAMRRRGRRQGPCLARPL